MRAVNLLPRESSSRARVSQQQLPALIAAAATVIAVGVLSFGYLSSTAKVADARRTLSDAQAQLAATPLPPAVPAATNTTPPAVAAQEQPRLDAVTSALSTRIAWDRILREFSLVLPDDVWLTNLTMTAPTAAGAATGLQLTGSTYTYASVARLLSRLSLVPDLNAVDLKSTAKSGKLVTFSVTAGVKGAVVPVVPPVTPPATGASS